MLNIDLKNDIKSSFSDTEKHSARWLLSDVIEISKIKKFEGFWVTMDIHSKSIWFIGS